MNKFLKNFLKVLIPTIISFVVGFLACQHIWKAKILPFSKPFDFKISYYDYTYSGTSGNYIDDSVLAYGAFEKPEINLLIDLAKKLNVNDSVVLDVGANTGLHSMALAKHFKTIHAIEPFPPVLKKLHENIENNNITNVIIHEVGLGKEKGELPFFVPPSTNNGIGTFSKEFTESSRNEYNPEDLKKPIMLPLVTGDEFMKNNSIPKVDLIKLDIEGYEKFALIGLKETLSKYRPIIVMELNRNDKEGFLNFQELENIFPENYKIYDLSISSEDLKTGDYNIKEVNDYSKSQRNILVIPTEKENLLVNLKS